MHPILYQSDNLIIDSYSFFFLLAWLVGGVIFYREFRRMDWPLEDMLFVMAGCIFGAIVGSFLFHGIFPAWEGVAQPEGRLIDFTGKTVLGGIAGGYIGVELTKKKIGYPHSTGDAFAIAIPLGHAIGRVGCLLGGCCFGTACTLPWGISYEPGSYPFIIQLLQGQITPDAPATFPVHPTQVYEILFNLALFGVLYSLRDKLKVRGSLFKLYLVSYGSFRFLTEFIRGDSPFPADGGLKTVQAILIAVILYFGWVFYRNELKPTPGKA